MKPSSLSHTIRAILVLSLLPIGCLLVQRGEAEPLAAAQPEPPQSIFNPPFETTPSPIDSLTVDHDGGVLMLSSGTQITVPAAAFVDTAGMPVTEPVELTVREFLNPIETWLGGIPMNAGKDAVFRSAGMMEIRGTTAGGREVALATGKTLQVDWYSVDPDPSYVTWALDTATGVWSETGGANTLKSRDLEMESREAEAALPPRVNPVAPSRHAFDIADLTGNQPELARFRGVQFVPADGRPCGHDATRIEVEPITDGSGGAFMVRFILDTVIQTRFKASSFDTLTYLAPYVLDTMTECRCNVALPPGAGEREAARIQRLLNGDTDRQRERGRRAAMRLWNEYNAAVERQFLTDAMRPSGLPDRPDQPGFITRRTMEVDRLGYINCDIIIPYPDEVDLLVDLIGSDGSPLDVHNLAVLDVDTRTLYPCDGGRIRLDPGRRNAVFGYAGGQLVYLTREQIEKLETLPSGSALMPSLAALSDLSDPASNIAQLILGS